MEEEEEGRRGRRKISRPKNLRVLFGFSYSILLIGSVTFMMRVAVITANLCLLASAAGSARKEEEVGSSVPTKR